MKIIFLHHSTGRIIWDAGVKDRLREYSRGGGVKCRIKERAFPREKPYGWKNYPYDYWNIWVKNGDGRRYMKEPTLEYLTRKYDIIVFKHCFPVSKLNPCGGGRSVDSEFKCPENYRLQYEALRDKMRSYPETRFLVWTGAALVAGATDPGSARRARSFFEWVRDEWDEKGDNIFIWDFFELETEGGLYLRDEYARSSTNSHPSESFARQVAPLFCNRLIDVIEGTADSTSVTGKRE
ncbi:MAG: hypothetical protein GF417_07870 [Candidatus Latescibacteria bacterium]|nr:hypothetical protein [bacterium]MBD3424337.1 hypothetical protein [Candidatus Latescibacterota bacterium]